MTATRPAAPAPFLSAADQQLLVMTWDRFARRAVRLWVPWARPCTDEYDDALQVARLGLVTAARKFDPARGLSFGTLAWWSCRTALWLWRTSRRPLGYREHAAPPRVVPLSAIADPDGRPFDVAAAAGPDPADALDAAELRARVADLPAREAEVLGAVYGAGESGSAVARRLGVSRGRVAQLTRRGLERLREGVRADAGQVL